MHVRFYMQTSSGGTTREPIRVLALTFHPERRYLVISNINEILNDLLLKEDIHFVCLFVCSSADAIKK